MSLQLLIHDLIRNIDQPLLIFLAMTDTINQLNFATVKFKMSDHEICKI